MYGSYFPSLSGLVAITASAIQESAGLMVTISLALTAVFGFSVSKNFDENNLNSHASIVLTTIFGVSLTFVMVYAYGVYFFAITAQSDGGIFFLDKINPLLTSETRWLMVCAVLSILALCWRCTKGLRGGGG